MTAGPEPGGANQPEPAAGHGECATCGVAIAAGAIRCDTCATMIGDAVRQRLNRLPGLHKLPVEALEVYLMRDFLSEEECAGLMALIDADKVPSGLLGGSADPTFRTSESCNLRPNNPAVRQVEAKLTALMGIDSPLGETIQGQRYDLTQRFKPHHDFFFTDQGYWEQEKSNGGQRTWTAMIFLNEPEAGGQTFFPKVGVRITPRRGNILIWNNLDRRGEPNMFSLHEACPVEAGLKYVITKWYRERPWGRAAPAPYAAPRFTVSVTKGEAAKP